MYKQCQTTQEHKNTHCIMQYEYSLTSALGQIQMIFFCTFTRISDTNKRLLTREDF